MAIISEITCHACGQAKSVMHSLGEPAPVLCGECAEKESSAKKEAFLAQLARSPIEERLRRIEEQLYDRNHQRTYSPLDCIG